MLLGENRCWLLLGPQGLKQLSRVVLGPVNTNPDKKYAITKMSIFRWIQPKFHLPITLEIKAHRQLLPDQKLIYMHYSLLISHLIGFFLAAQIIYN